MEASQAGVVINNSNSIVLTVDVAIKYAAGIAGGGLLTGIIVSFGLKVGDGFLKEFFSNRTERKTLKRKLGQELMEICIEGANSGYMKKPGSQRHIQLKAAEIETFDPGSTKKLQKYLIAWVLGCNDESNSMVVAPIEHNNYARENRGVAQKLGEDLLAVAREWKK